MNEYQKVMTDANNLYDAALAAIKINKWKATSQKFEMNMLYYISKAQKELTDQTYKNGDVNEFVMSERGKTRAISSLSPYDKMIRHVFCDKILVPKLEKYLIYDNGASIKGKGISFTRRRFKEHLQKYYREYGTNEGYILFGDFSKYYDNILHSKIREDIGKVFDYDPYVMWLLNEMLKGFEIDMSDREESVEELLLEKFNRLEYKNPHKGKKMIPKSVNIGDQLSQIIGVFYPHKIDNYIKIVQGNKYYGRYMDDFYVISKDKEYLKQLIKDIIKIADEYGINMNLKKTRIIKISSVYKFLQIRYSLTDTGKVITKINPKCVTRMRRKIKKLVNKDIDYKTIENTYRGWFYSFYKYMSNKTKDNINDLYNELYIEPFLKKKIMIGGKV